VISQSRLRNGSVLSHGGLGLDTGLVQHHWWRSTDALLRIHWRWWSWSTLLGWHAILMLLHWRRWSTSHHDTRSTYTNISLNTISLRWSSISHLRICLRLHITWLMHQRSLLLLRVWLIIIILCVLLLLFLSLFTIHLFLFLVKFC
jgi:hypothetical protein